MAKLTWEFHKELQNHGIYAFTHEKVVRDIEERYGLKEVKLMLDERNNKKFDNEKMEFMLSKGIKYDKETGYWFM